MIIVSYYKDKDSDIYYAILVKVHAAPDSKTESHVKLYRLGILTVEHE